MELQGSILHKLQIRRLDDLRWLKPQDLMDVGLRLADVRRFEELQGIVTDLSQRSVSLSTLWTHSLEDLRRTKPEAFDVLTILAWYMYKQ